MRDYIAAVEASAGWLTRWHANPGPFAMNEIKFAPKVQKMKGLADLADKYVILG